MKTKTKIHFVYITTNLINGNEYTGIHSTYDINDGYLGSGKILTKAIVKYGKKNFKREIISQFPTRRELFEKEKELVNSEYLRKQNTYNCALGGGGYVNWVETVPDFNNYELPYYKQDSIHLQEFYVDESNLEEFKKIIEVDMNADSWDLATFRKQACWYFLSDIHNTCKTLTNYWNDQRFNDYASNAVHLLFQLGFGMILKTRPINALLNGN
jgi:hypothetical protein